MQKSKLQGLTIQDYAINTKIYEEYTQLHMEDGWAANHKRENYQQLLHILTLTKDTFDQKSCLDVGCGTGDLSAFVKKLGATKYLGVDMYQPAIEKARKKYPQEQFILGDFLTVPIPNRFDYTFCSGSLSVKLATDNYHFLEATVKKMWKLTNKGAAFNILTDTDTDPDTDLFFYNIEKVVTICKAIAPKDTVFAKLHPSKAEAHVYLY